MPSIVLTLSSAGAASTFICLQALHSRLISDLLVCAGPTADVKAFVSQLESEGIFARALETNGVPYHSPVLEPLLAELSESESCVSQLVALADSLNWSVPSRWPVRLTAGTCSCSWGVS